MLQDIEDEVQRAIEARVGRFLIGQRLNLAAPTIGQLPPSAGGTGTTTGAPSLTVDEADGAPSVAGVTHLTFSNGTVTDNGSGHVTVTTGGGSGGGTSLLLNYLAATDIASGVALTANTWTDIGTNQSFTVANASSAVAIAVRGNILVGTNVAGIGARIVIDSGGTPITRLVGGTITVNGQYVNALTGTATVLLVGLAAGAHTTKVQVFADNGNSAYCRPATKPTEFLGIVVLEYLP